MEKTQLELDLDEWEYLPDILEDTDKEKKKKKKKIISSSKLVGGGTSNYSTTVFNMDYFMCPSPPISDKIVQQQTSSPVRFHNKVVSVPIQLEPRVFNHTPDDEIGKDLIFMSENNEMMNTVDKDPAFESNQDSVSQVFFKKMEENKFVDMKMDSPRSPTSRNIMMPQIETFNSDGDEAAPAIDDGNGFDLWKWSLTGIGAICSFGVAAATICIIIFGNNRHHQKQQQKLRFQIYSDDKRIKQVVHQNTKLNEAISAVRGRGVPITRAHITYGGYYDSL